jgi:pyruvate,water dikinase
MSGAGSQTRIEDLEFQPPGPGPWEIDATHAPHPGTRFMAEIHPGALARGFEDTFRRYGLVLKHLQWIVVNGFAYRQLAPAPDEEIPERFAAAERAFETKLWREDMRRWDQEVKPRAIAGHLALQEVDPAALDDEELAAHITACREHCERMIEQHHQFNVAAMLPTGDFIVQAGAMTGAPPNELLMLLRGSAPVSAAGADGLGELASAIRNDPSAGELLDPGRDPAEALKALRTHPGAVGEAASHYLKMVSWRLLDGLDIGYPVAIEKPEMLLDTIRRSVAADASAANGAGDSNGIADALSGEDRARFDELLDDARHTYRLRDERGIYSEVWGYGLARRAFLAAGERLAERGKLDDPVHAVEASHDEILALLRGEDGPSAAELADRASYRERYSAKDAPANLGPEPPPPPSLDGLPPAVARMMAGVGTAIGLLFTDSDAEHAADVVRGLPASPGVYEGTARVLNGPHELDRLQQGDVLVTGSTTEAFNIALPLVGAIVTDSGGLLSLEAVVAREFEVPGVVGTREATGLIADGARVRVDGGAGEVTVLS